jgi:hypothetical protein
MSLAIAVIAGIALVLSTVVPVVLTHRYRARERVADEKRRLARARRSRMLNEASARMLREGRLDGREW